jgi:hypothetical protein
MHIEVTRGPNLGAALVVAARPQRIGTADDNDLVVRDGTASRHHCEVEPSPDGAGFETSAPGTGSSPRACASTTPSSFRHAHAVGRPEIVATPLGESLERELTTRDRFGEVLGGAPRMRDLFADLERILRVGRRSAA